MQFPHGKRDKETNKVERCDAIEKVLWRVNRSSGESYFVFSGGLPEDVTGSTPSITIMQVNGRGSIPDPTQGMGRPRVMQ